MSNDDEITKIRLALLDNGIRPIPCEGKKPVLDNWPNARPTREEIGAWIKNFPRARGTGVNGRDVVGLDIDIKLPDAASACEDETKDWIGDSGLALVRFGNRPKRLLTFTTDLPFAKILRVLKDVNGEKHRIEALCDGQQFLVDGLNPDANVNYAWHAGRTLANTNLADLPITTAEDMEKLVDHLVDMLVEKFGFEDITGQGDGPRTEWREDGEKFDPEAALAAMLPDPASVENVQRRVALSWMRSGMHPDEILERLVTRTMEVAKAGGLNWDHNKEVSEVSRRIIDRFRFLARDYKTELPPWLPGEFHVDYMDVVSHRLTPILSRNRYGFFIRKAGRDANGSAKNGNGHAADGLGQEQPSTEPPKTEPPKTERKLQFRLIRYKDMRPGVDPTYLVDELIPSAGLVLLWGKEKTYKSFWLLDLALHVAMGWTYRDRAVQQGPVVYCAFEGGHGFKGRIEAQRRHYRGQGLISDDEDVPLFVMPGQAKLIAEHAKLIAEFKLQLGDVVPRLVVLDTLNRSIDGSESKDIDMTAYVRAAEAIRAAFGCVVIVVHHCGYDDSHARGHTSLAAAVDAELSITRAPGTPLCEVTVKHMREGPEDTKVVSKAKMIPLDPDRNGRPRSSIVLTETDEAIDPTAGKGGRPDEAAQVLQFALRMAMEPHGVMHTPDGKLPLRAVEKAHLREMFYRHYVDGEDNKERSADARKKAFGRALSKLVKAHIIRGCNLGDDKTLIWFVSAERAVGE